jgi:hypothetical protein
MISGTGPLSAQAMVPGRDSEITFVGARFACDDDRRVRWRCGRRQAKAYLAGLFVRAVLRANAAVPQRQTVRRIPLLAVSHLL